MKMIPIKKLPKMLGIAESTLLIYRSYEEVEKFLILSCGKKYLPEKEFKNFKNAIKARFSKCLF